MYEVLREEITIVVSVVEHLYSTTHCGLGYDKLGTTARYTIHSGATHWGLGHDTLENRA